MLGSSDSRDEEEEAAQSEQPERSERPEQMGVIDRGITESSAAHLRNLLVYDGEPGNTRGAGHRLAFDSRRRHQYNAERAVASLHASTGRERGKNRMDYRSLPFELNGNIIRAFYRTPAIIMVTWRASRLDILGLPACINYYPDSIALLALHKTGRRLERFAHMLGLQFEFNPWMGHQCQF